MDSIGGPSDIADNLRTYLGLTLIAQGPLPNEAHARAKRGKKKKKSSRLTNPVESGVEIRNPLPDVPDVPDVPESRGDWAPSTCMALLL